MAITLNKKELISFSLISLASAIVVVQLVSGSLEVSDTNNMSIKSSIDIKKVAMIVAYRDFRDQEYFIPKRIFEKAGMRVVTASNKEGTAIGIDGGEASVGLTISSLKASDYEAIVFVGGSGAVEYLDIADSYRLAKDAVAENKVLGAICVAPVVLANGGVLSGKNATVWSGTMDKTAVNAIKAGGANYTSASVVTDGLIVTGNGPEASEEFAKEIMKLVVKALDNKLDK